VFGAFDDRNLARSGALSYGPPALDDINECLEGSKWITSSERSGPGITLRFNLTHIMETLLDMQEAIVSYSAQNPTDDLC
jgi:hypothetical protein